MKNFDKMNECYLKLKKWMPQKLAYKLTVLYVKYQEGENMMLKKVTIKQYIVLRAIHNTKVVIASDTEATVLIYV